MRHDQAYATGSGVLRIGACTRQAVLQSSEIVKGRYGALADAIPLIADPLVRNRGTFGGNLANGDPANDGPAIAIALGAQLVVRGPSGERTIAANRFYKDLFVTDLKDDEILVEIRIPVPPPRSGTSTIRSTPPSGVLPRQVLACGGTST